MQGLRSVAEHDAALADDSAGIFEHQRRSILDPGSCRPVARSSVQD
jgi:hypothetical protein